MIDLNREIPRPITEIADLLGVHASTVYRWTKPNGRAPQLESIQIGGRRYTSLDALQRYSDAGGSMQMESPDTGEARSEEAARELRRHGI